MHYASRTNQLSLVQALVAAGAHTTKKDKDGWPPLWHAVDKGQTDIVAYLLQLPAVQSMVTNARYYHDWTAFAQASTRGVSSVVQLLLDAGADPTIPFGENSPLNLAIEAGHAAVADLFRAAITKFELPRTVFKVCALVDAALALPKAQRDAIEKGLSVAAMQRAILRATPAGLKKYVAWGKELPLVELAPQRKKRGEGDEQLRATVAFVVGFEESAIVMPEEVFDELLDYLLPAGVIS